MASVQPSSLPEGPVSSGDQPDPLLRPYVDEPSSSSSACSSSSSSSSCDSIVSCSSCLSAPSSSSSASALVASDEKNQLVTKRIFLIRHCESQNNVDKREVSQAFKNPTKSLKLKTMKQLITLAGVPMDSELSIPGREQLRQQARRLEEADFINKHAIAFICHSHLRRAADTCKGLFFEKHASKILEHKMLYERDVLEHLGRKDMKVRTEHIKRYLLNRPEDTIVLVGHSAVFRDFMERADKVDNCDVWEVTLAGVRGPQADAHATKDDDVLEGSCMLCAKKVKRGNAAKCTLCGWVFHRKCVVDANIQIDSESASNPHLRLKQLPRVCQKWDIRPLTDSPQTLHFQGGNFLLTGTDYEVKIDSSGSRSSRRPAATTATTSHTSSSNSSSNSNNDNSNSSGKSCSSTTTNTATTPAPTPVPTTTITTTTPIATTATAAVTATTTTVSNQAVFSAGTAQQAIPSDSIRPPPSYEANPDQSAVLRAESRLPPAYESF